MLDVVVSSRSMISSKYVVNKGMVCRDHEIDTYTSKNKCVKLGVLDFEE